MFQEYQSGFDEEVLRYGRSKRVAEARKVDLNEFLGNNADNDNRVGDRPHTSHRRKENLRASEERQIHSTSGRLDEGDRDSHRHTNHASSKEIETRIRNEKEREQNRNSAKTQAKDDVAKDHEKEGKGAKRDKEKERKKRKKKKQKKDSDADNNSKSSSSDSSSSSSSSSSESETNEKGSKSKNTKEKKKKREQIVSKGRDLDGKSLKKSDSPTHNARFTNESGEDFIKKRSVLKSPSTCLNNWPFSIVSSWRFRNVSQNKPTNLTFEGTQINYWGMSTEEALAAARGRVFGSSAVGGYGFPPNMGGMPYPHPGVPVPRYSEIAQHAAPHEQNGSQTYRKVCARFLYCTLGFSLQRRTR